MATKTRTSPGTYTAGRETLNHLLHLVHQARPEWDPALVRVVLLDLVPYVHGNDLAIAALRAAADDNLPGPKAIRWRGQHWQGLGSTPPEIKAVEWCGICGRREPDCYSTRFAGDDHPFEATTRRPIDRR